MDYPEYMHRAISDGYRITSKILLLYCPMPCHGLVPQLRTTILALEAAVTCIFWAMHERKAPYGFERQCLGLETPLSGSTMPDSYHNSFLL